MQVVILCGGKGTRMYPTTEELPKPLIHVGNRPIIWHIMKLYSHYGFNDFILCLGYKGEGPGSFTIASPTGEGVTTARHFTRLRRCVISEHFGIV